VPRLRIHLYAEPASPNLELRLLVEYLRGLLPFEVEARESFFALLDERQRESAALGFARAKVRNPTRREEFEPLPGEIDYERRRLSSSGSIFGLAYDGYKVMALLRQLLPGEERNLGHLHIIFTNQLLATWEESRYHLRVGVFGYPCILSTTGAVEAPAKPREYYLLKQQYTALGMSDAAAVLEEELGKRVLRHDDPRLTEVMKGYVMQAVFYHLFGEAFCRDKGCRLYNAHWQEEMLYAQVESPYEFCPGHLEMLTRLREEGLG